MTFVALAIGLLILLTLSGLISAAETSMTAASRARLHQLEREGDRSAARVNKLLADQETMIGAILLSNNVINILASALTTAVLGSAFPGPLGIALSTGIMTVLIVVFSEILPKTLAITRADRSGTIGNLARAARLAERRARGDDRRTRGRTSQKRHEKLTPVHDAPS